MNEKRPYACGCEVTVYTNKVNTKEYFCEPGHESIWSEDAISRLQTARSLLIDCEIRLSKAVYQILWDRDIYWDKHTLKHIVESLDIIKRYLHDSKQFRTAFYGFKSYKYSIEELSISEDARGHDVIRLLETLMKCISGFESNLLAQRAKDDFERSFNRIRDYLSCIRSIVTPSGEQKSKMRSIPLLATNPISDDLIQNYKQILTRTWTDKYSMCVTDSDEYGITMECCEIDPKELPSGFVLHGNGFYQYKVKYGGLGSIYNIPAKLVPFFKTVSDPREYMVLDLCHNPRCMEWTHHVLVRDDEIKDRLTCPGVPECNHKPRCLIPGLKITL